VAVTDRLGRREGVRRLVAAAGLTPAVLAFLQGETSALARGEETDMAVLDAALVLEHQAIAVYDLGLREQLFPTGLREHAVEFRGDHLGHRDTQIAIVKERGGRPSPPPAQHALGHVRDGDAMLRLAVDIELAAQMAYTALISQIRTEDYLLSAAFILIDEVRHLTVWRRALGLRVY
jgi:hypothetical protein